MPTFALLIPSKASRGVSLGTPDAAAAGLAACKTPAGASTRVGVATGATRADVTPEPPDGSGAGSGGPVASPALAISKLAKKQQVKRPVRVI